MSKVIITYDEQNEGWVKVIAPYNEGFLWDFKEFIDRSFRVWVPEEKCWRVLEVYLNDVINICEKYFDEVDNQVLKIKINIFAELFILVPEYYVDKVYGALAQAFHPDHNGNSELMKQLNSVYEKRKNANKNRS